MSEKKKKNSFLLILSVIAVVLLVLIIGFTVKEHIGKKESVPTYASTEIVNNVNVVSLNEVTANVNQVQENTIKDNVVSEATNEIKKDDVKEETKNEIKEQVKSENKTESTAEKETVNVPVSKDRKIDSSKPMVALTFDDGPGKSTTKILNTLEKYNVVATFFDLGQNMLNNPSTVKREEAIGCEVESHTYAHKNLNKLSATQIKEDMKKAENAFEKVLGHKPHLVRPPYGNANATVKNTLKYPLINWDIDTLDWKSRNADSIMKEIHKYSSYDGRIILMHGIYDSTAEAVARLVPELINKGYQLVTVSEMAKYKGVTLKTGTVYLNFRK